MKVVTYSFSSAEGFALPFNGKREITAKTGLLINEVGIQNVFQIMAAENTHGDVYRGKFLRSV